MDTSASAIAWNMTALMKASRVMKKLQQEIRESIGQKGIVEEDDLKKLHYLKAVINESFRLYPTCPLLVPRETMETCILGGYEIQPGTKVYVNAWAIGRDPHFWENAHEFLPERFLEKDIDIKGPEFGVIPFGSGRRICPGMLMGLTNVELILANLIYWFDWELPDGVEALDVDTDSLPGLTMHKKNPLYIVPKKYVP